jgi:hypothetical protein
MGEQQQEEAKLVIVYFANGTKQWVKSGSTNLWAREGGRVCKFYEGKVYDTSPGRKVKIKQHFKLLNAVLMDVETGEFLATDRPQLLELLPNDSDNTPLCKWWEVNWGCEIVFEKKEDKPAVKTKPTSAVTEKVVDQ